MLTSLSVNLCRVAIDYLADIGHIYSTIDESHYKSAFNE